MARRLAVAVVVHDDKGGSITYPVGSTPPTRHARKITNPDVWVPAEDADTGDTAARARADQEAREKAAEQAREQEATAARALAEQQGAGGPPGSGSPTGVTAPEAPPRGGAGSGTEAWATYAEALGQDVAGLGQAEIIAKLEAADLIPKP